MKLQLKTIAGSLIFEGDFTSMADLVKAAILEEKTLSSANLSSANLRYANLSYADLRYADLSSANLSYADLRYANLRSADLSSANLSSANLRSANLSSANLSSANLSYAKNSEMAVAMTRILPEGTIIGWKKCANNVIVKLRIPETAKRCHAFGRKCRAEFAEVLETSTGKKAKSRYDSDFTYEVGETVRPTSPFNTDFTNECSAGIHFFITKEEAMAYDE